MFFSDFPRYAIGISPCQTGLPTAVANPARLKPEPKPEPTLKPVARPARKLAPKAPAVAAVAPPPSKKSADAKAAAPTKQAGTATAAVPQGQLNDLKARWGAAIRARIERRKTVPRALASARGTVTVQLIVLRNGALAGVSVATSSGNPALDRAALKAVTAAGPFPAAPKALSDARYSFGLPMTFAP